jgi:hypothetical protein
LGRPMSLFPLNFNCSALLGILILSILFYMAKPLYSIFL